MHIILLLILLDSLLSLVQTNFQVLTLVRPDQYIFSFLFPVLTYYPTFVYAVLFVDKGRTLVLNNFLIIFFTCPLNQDIGELLELFVHLIQIVQFKYCEQCILRFWLVWKKNSNNKSRINYIRNIIAENLLSCTITNIENTQRGN